MFLGDCGRPDYHLISEDKVEEYTGYVFESLRLLDGLDKECLVFPAHCNIIIKMYFY